GYVEREIISNNKLKTVLWGGTDYVPVIRSNLMTYCFMEEEAAGGLLGMIFGMSRDTFGEETLSGFPAINYFLTDGENADRDGPA
ncbi:hypothetical protein ACC756_38480, partial [Rhizobium ruizarguesonis]